MRVMGESWLEGDRSLGVRVMGGVVWCEGDGRSLGVKVKGGV